MECRSESRRLVRVCKREGATVYGFGAGAFEEQSVGCLRNTALKCLSGRGNPCNLSGNAEFFRLKVFTLRHFYFQEVYYE